MSTFKLRNLTDELDYSTGLSGVWRLWITQINHIPAHISASVVQKMGTVCNNVRKHRFILKFKKMFNLTRPH